MAAGSCEGSAAKRLAVRVKAITDSGGGLGTGHGFWLSGSVLWCNICGAFAEGCGTMALAKPCTGRRVRGPRQAANQGGRNGLLQQLRNLQKGFHPKTGRLLPPAVPIDQSADVPAEMVANYASQEGRIYQLATPETLSAPLQSMLERVRKRAADRIAELPAAKRRISVKTSPSAAGSSRNTLLSTLPSHVQAD